MQDKQERMRWLQERLAQLQDRRKRRLFDPKHGWLLLFILTAVTLMAVSGTMARYATELQMGATAQVAAFVTGDTLQLQAPLTDLVPDSEREITFDVKNFQGSAGAETWLEYDISVASLGNLPLSFRLAGSREAGDEHPHSALAALGEMTDGTATGGKLPVADGAGGRRTTHSYSLYVKWDPNETGEEYIGEVDMVTITINTRQATETDGTS